jgi:hypothetical protein
VTAPATEVGSSSAPSDRRNGPDSSAIPNVYGLRSRLTNTAAQLIRLGGRLSQQFVTPIASKSTFAPAPRNPPARRFLGVDALGLVAGKLAEMNSGVAAWETLSRSTSYAQ